MPTSKARRSKATGKTTFCARQLLFILPFLFLLASGAGQSTIWELKGLTGYSDLVSVAAGETIRFMVSTGEPHYQMDIVRLIHGDTNPNGPGFKEEHVQTAVNARYPGRKQELHPGSYVVVPHSPLLQPSGSFTLQAWIYPTTPRKGLQGIITKWSPDSNTGYGLFIDGEGHLALWVGDGAEKIDRVATAHPLQPRSWTRVTAVFEAPGRRIALYQEPLRDWPLGNTRVVVSESIQAGKPGTNTVPLVMGAVWESHGEAKENAGAHFNGKIDSPRIFAAALGPEQLASTGSETESMHWLPLVAAWDFSVDIPSRGVIDTSGSGLHGHSINMPMRGVTGYRWTGKKSNFNTVPEEYGAIHFHDDDLDDAEWDVDFAFQVPTSLDSGVYAARLRAGEHEDYLPFFVRPQKGTAGARIAYLFPTFNYLAYSSFNLGFPGLLSLYDHHSDGSGVAYASRLRPLADIRPKIAIQSSTAGEPFPRHFSADLYLVDWMEARGHDYDVITDEDLHLEGAALLDPYNVVVTGSHPEYWSQQMLDALQRYLHEGGRLMYLGGNGFYWVTSQSPEEPHIIEVRRWGGTRTWSASPGEYYHSTTGELGGLWRARGRPPQKLVGVGFTAQGWTPEARCGLNRPYRRQPGSFDPRAAFIFEGIGEEETISGFPSLGLGPGAAGDEIDRMDFDLGTPAHTLLLASATGFSEDYLPVVEEAPAIDSSLTQTPNPLVRADMVFFEYPNGGAVFSVGSISWFGSLSYNDYDNNVSRITDNVLSTFARDEPLPGQP